MTRISAENKTLFFIIFALSGFSGLIYESVWSHYLKLFLGHAAYAQTLVLIIFMGGMALGAWAVGRYSTKIKNLLRKYALAEGVIGIIAILFHPLFTSTMDATFYSLIPNIDAPALAGILKWSIAALLILPQSILLGATFPLMSGGVIRRFPQTPGHSLGVLYFTNSLGAAVGVLVSGFLLIHTVGLPGTIITAGLINIILAVIVFKLSATNEPVANKGPVAPVTPPDKEPAAPPLSGRIVIGFFFVAALTGTASFLYEIGWIRMLSLVLGSTTHAFELMLSAFILGLAIGGYWISRRIDSLKQPVKWLGMIQLVMGGLALLTLLSYDGAFHLMGYAVNAFPKTGGGYVLFNLLSHGLALLVMVPTTICAGMTLPLITYYLFSKGYGERAIGKIYGVNTLGSIIGVVLAVHFIMPLLGVKHVIVFGGAVDILLGLALLWRVRSTMPKLRLAAITGVFAVILAVGILFFHTDPAKMASGVYKNGMVKTDGKVRFHKDGKTASVAVIDYTDIQSLSLTTNGKSDAAISYSSTPRPDEPTMILLGALPMAFHKDSRTAANIGFGSGLTTQMVLLDPAVESVDTVEIEPAILEGAKLFGRRVEQCFTDPRSHIHIDDAKTFFYSQKKKYDIIISEPSNPWISGISSLFSVEFYRLIHHFLEDDGIFCQWVHLYEMDVPLVASIVKALAVHFDDYAIYFTTDTNMVILASKRTIPSEPVTDVFAIPGVKRELARVGIYNVRDLKLRRLGTRKTLDALFNSYDIPANSDYFPVLDGGAARARFLGASAKDLNRLYSIDVPFMEVLEGDTPPDRSLYSLNPFSFWQASRAKEARAIYQYFVSLKNPDFIPAVAMDTKNFQAVQAMRSGKGHFGMLQRLVYATLTYLSEQEMALIWETMEASALYQTVPETMRQVLNMYQALSRRDFRDFLYIAEPMLGYGEVKGNEKNDFLVKAVLLAHVALDQYEEAQTVLNNYQPSGELPMEIRLLQSIITEKK